MAHVIKSMSNENPLVLFSGDAFSPSAMSTITLGAHMPPILNTLNIKAACLGNHDLDFGLPACQALVKQCNFPWLASNVLEVETGKLIPGFHRTVMLEHQGVKVGVMGIIEPEWLQTLAALDPATLVCLPFVDEARKIARELRAQGAEVVVALSHMREPNDEILPRPPLRGAHGRAARRAAGQVRHRLQGADHHQAGAERRPCA